MVSVSEPAIVISAEFRRTPDALFIVSVPILPSALDGISFPVVTGAAVALKFMLHVTPARFQIGVRSREPLVRLMVNVEAAPIPRVIAPAPLEFNEPFVRLRIEPVVPKVTGLCRSTAGVAPDVLFIVRINILPAVPSVNVPVPDITCCDVPISERIEFTPPLDVKVPSFVRLPAKFMLKLFRRILLPPAPVRVRFPPIVEFPVSLINLVAALVTVLSTVILPTGTRVPGLISNPSTEPAEVLIPLPRTKELPVKV